MRAIQALRMRRPVSGVGDPYWTNVKLLVGFDGTNGSTTILDESASARGTGTAIGDAKISTALSKFGSGSLLVDGTGDAYRWNIGTDTVFPGQFTVECWIRFATTPGGAADISIIDKWNTGVGRCWYLGHYAGTMYAALSTNGSSASIVLNPAWAPVGGQWYHVAMDRDASDVFRIYLDGVMQAKATSAGSTFSGGSQNVSIGGGDGTPPTYPLNGNVDEVRITKGTARYASDSGFTVPAAAYPRA